MMSLMVLKWNLGTVEEYSWEQLEMYKSIISHELYC